LPKSRLDFWLPKLEGNRARDERNKAALEALGWRVIEVWECETKPDALRDLAGRRRELLVAAAAERITNLPLALPIVFRAAVDVHEPRDDRFVQFELPFPVGPNERCHQDDYELRRMQQIIC
jgi:hypothetical protein